MVSPTLTHHRRGAQPLHLPSRFRTLNVLDLLGVNMQHNLVTLFATFLLALAACQGATLDVSTSDGGLLTNPSDDASTTATEDAAPEDATTEDAPADDTSALADSSQDTGTPQDTATPDTRPPMDTAAPPDTAPEPDTAEPDLVGLSIGKDEARALEPDIDLDSGAAEPDYPDISDDVAEIRFYRDQGLDDDAEAALEDLRARYPGHPALASFGEPEAPSQAAPVPVEHGASSPLVALDEDEDEDAYLSAIFSEPAPAAPKKPATTGARVASENVDAQSAFDLGVAYREMGLVDQAVSQFESAASDPGLKVRALVMLGTLRLQQGDAPGAVSSLEQAVQGATNVDEKAEANYELGVVYEKIGETSKAIASLSAVSAGYRDRDERLGQLQG